MQTGSEDSPNLPAAAELLPPSSLDKSDALSRRRLKAVHKGLTFLARFRWIAVGLIGGMLRILAVFCLRGLSFGLVSLLAMLARSLFSEQTCLPAIGAMTLVVFHRPVEADIPPIVGFGCRSAPRSMATSHVEADIPPIVGFGGSAIVAHAILVALGMRRAA